MANFGTALFQGTIPQREDHDLPDSNGTQCTNATLDRGSIGPIKGMTLVEDLGAGPLRTIYKMGDLWLRWEGVRHVVKAEMANSDHRIYWTSGALDFPKQSNATLSAAYFNYYRLGVKSPLVCYPTTSALTMSPLGTGDGEIVQNVSYVYTYVDALGGESAPSAPTANYDAQGGQYMVLQNFQVPNKPTCGSVITHIRVYRLEDDGAGGSQYMLIAVRPVNLTANEVYDVPVSLLPTPWVRVYDANAPTSPVALTSSISESLPSEGWAHLPDSAALLTQWQNGVLASALGNEIFVSEPLIHYAWPISYRALTDGTIKGLGVCRESLIVPTDSYPYVLGGSDPANMYLEKLPFKQACLGGSRAILSTPDGVIYPSPDGLYIVDGPSGRLMTEQLISKDQWASSYHPADILSFAYDEEGYFFRTGYPTGFIIDLAAPNSLREIDLMAGTNDWLGLWHTFYDAANDTLYLLIYSGLTETYQIYSAFTDSTLLPWTWRSKLYRYPQPISMSTARVFADFVVGVTFKVYADGVLRFQKTVTENKPFRLAGGFRAKTWQVEMTSTDKVTSYQVATSTTELVRMPINAG
jgi:hypothetical protein